MLKRIICSVAIALGVVLHGANASASTITVVEHLDVANIVPGLSGFTGGVQGVGPGGFQDPLGFDLAVGDTFDFTILFDGALTIDNPTSLWAFAYATYAQDVTGTGSLALLDSGGSAIYTSSTKTDTEGVAHFGQYFSNTDFPSLPASVTFSGLHYVGTVDSYVDPQVNDPNSDSFPAVLVRTYNSPAFYFTADSFTATSVPDASSAMLLLGLGLTGLEAVRRRTRV